MKEIWKSISGYEGLYEVSNFGRVKALSKIVSSHFGGAKTYPEKIKSYRVTPTGYCLTTLHNNGLPKTGLIHRLVAAAFLPNPDNLPQVNHKDGDKSNNNVDNLEWCTCSENQIHAFKIGLKTPNKKFCSPKNGAQNGNAKKIIQMDASGNVIKEWPCGIDAAKAIGIKSGNIHNCAAGRQNTAGGFVWKYKTAV